MHEISVLYKMIEQVEEVAVQNNVKKIASVSVEVGELSGILPVFFEKYYPIVIENKELFEGSELVVSIIPGEALCNECKALYNVTKNEGQCPRCNSSDKTILGGRGFIIKNIMVKDS